MITLCGIGLARRYIDKERKKYRAPDNASSPEYPAAPISVEGKMFAYGRAAAAASVFYHDKILNQTNDRARPPPDLGRDCYGAARRSGRMAVS